MKGNDWLYIGLGVAAVYAVYKIVNIKSETLSQLDQAGGTAASLLNPKTEYGWGVDFAKWLGFNTPKPTPYVNNWYVNSLGQPVVNPAGTGMDNPTKYTYPQSSNLKNMYIGEMTQAEIADWTKSGWKQSGSYLVSPSQQKKQSDTMAALWQSNVIPSQAAMIQQINLKNSINAQTANSGVRTSTNAGKTISKSNVTFTNSAGKSYTQKATKTYYPKSLSAYKYS